MTQTATHIAVLVSSLHEPVQALMWEGVHRAAEEQGVRLTAFVATSQDGVDTLEPHFNVVEDFVRCSGVQGVIVFAGAIADFTPPGFVQQLCASFAPLPTVSLNFKVPGVPSVLPNNTAGIVEIIDHYVTIHGYDRIAFIRGPQGHPEAEERFAAYKRGLERNGIAYDPKLVFDGAFSFKAGVQAAQRMLEEKIVVQAFLCADDDIALGVISQLRKSGFHVPTDVAVAGFDDIEGAQVALPSLTTVRQPFKDMGRRAVETVLTMSAGAPVEEVSILPTTPVYRRSCGCFPQSIRESRPPEDFFDSPRDRDGVLAAMVRKATMAHAAAGAEGGGAEIIAPAVERILDAFEEAVTQPGQDARFLDALDAYVFRMTGEPADVDALQDVLQELTAYLANWSQSSEVVARGVTLLQQAQTLLREHKLRLTQARNMEETAFQLRIRETSQKIITTFDRKRLRQTLVDAFPAIGVNRFAFALYESPAMLTTETWTFPDTARLVAGFDTARGVLLDDEEGNSFPCSRILPSALGDIAEGHHVFMPIFFKNEQYGYVVFGYHPAQPSFMFEELRMHIGSALKSSMMMQELKIQSMVDELTGLYNRRGFMTLSRQLIDSAARTGGRLLVFFADIDGLKRINDVHGHDAGDAAIVGAARVLGDTFRNKDVIGRIGGDEFTVVIHVGDEADPKERILVRMRDKLEDFNRFSNQPFTLSLSVGASYFEPHGEQSLEEILKEADRRMLEKKRSKQER